VSDITFEEVVTAYYDCRKNKRNTKQQLEFEFRLEDNLWKLYEELKEETYRPGSHIFFIITQPKPREVWAANFKDRIVHHILYNRTEYIEKTYIPTTYACLKNRGTLYCAKDIQKTLRKLWPQKDDYLILHTDIANFFVSIDKETVCHQIKKFIKNKTTLDLLNLFIFQKPTNNFTYKGKKELKDLIPQRKSLFDKETGLPIGNLTSQVFANLYLSDFDWFCRKEITPYYFRYMDDLLFLIPKTAGVHKTINKINDYLKIINLRLNSSKTKHNKLEYGVNFVGYYVKPFSIYIRNSTKHRSKRASEIASINSYYGMFRHINCYNLRKSIAKRNNLTMSYYEKLI
jgi:RNA-directed DNA polymerase